MYSLLTAILLLGATGSAQRSMKVDQQISGIVARVIGGAIGEQFGSTADKRPVRDWIIRGDCPTVVLTIDNQPRTGWRAWGQAAIRAGRFAMLDSTPASGGTAGTGVSGADGSVGYSYRLRVRGYDVRRATRIENGRVVLTTDAWWVERVPVGRSTRRIPIHVRFVIIANEGAGTSTEITGTATGTADTSGFRCSIIRRIAERQAATQLTAGLRGALGTIQQHGTDWYLGSADIGPILDGIGDAMRTIGPRIWRRR